MRRLQDAHRTQDTLVGVQVFGALAVDVITHYAYGESFEELQKPGFPCPLQRDVKHLLLTTHFRRYLPTLASAIQMLPERLLRRMTPAAASFLDFEHKLIDYAKVSLRTHNVKERPAKARTLLDALTAPSVPDWDKTVERLKDESQLVLLAGMDTSARFLTAMLCYMATYPKVLRKLRDELSGVATTKEAKLTWRQLEALPYLVS